MAKGYTLSSENRLKNLEPLRFSAADMRPAADGSLPFMKTMNTKQKRLLLRKILIKKRKKVVFFSKSSCKIGKAVI